MPFAAFSELVNGGVAPETFAQLLLRPVDSEFVCASKRQPWPDGQFNTISLPLNVVLMLAGGGTGEV